MIGPPSLPQCINASTTPSFIGLRWTGGCSSTENLSGSKPFQKYLFGKRWFIARDMLNIQCLQDKCDTSHGYLCFISKYNSVDETHFANMRSGPWNKRKLTSEISNRFLVSSVRRAWDWWSSGCEFKPHWGQFLMKFVLFCVTLDLSDNLTEMRLKGLSWKTQLPPMISYLWQKTQPQISVSLMCGIHLV